MTGTETPAAPTGVASIFKRVEQPAVQGWSPTLVRVQSTMRMGQFLQGGKNGRLMSFFFKVEPL